MDDGARRAPSSRVGRRPSWLTVPSTLLTYPVFYLTLIHFYHPQNHFYYPQNGFLLYKVEWGPTKNFSTPPFFYHKSATKRPLEHNSYLYHEGNKTVVLLPVCASLKNLGRRGFFAGRGCKILQIETHKWNAFTLPFMSFEICKFCQPRPAETPRLLNYFQLAHTGNKSMDFIYE